ncbi:ATP-binding cassette domain-containing protein [Streptomyces sp. SID13031]|uniref:ABC transporter ATP-binding protein n=1 Tax=Streptomyces sp. SID13031 TaxID=2706046 RepID=UPI0013C982D6|nr:ATP-binding cassette domain-containing protein [Streptomyces sp. SID13031]NEA33622.1 ATP-binding cassette domain-containing protein [Streptomyces sp. SID13031]
MLSVAGLTRRFGDHLALDDVSFDVRPGRMTGFVGANGAGKTTTMRIILGVLAPSGGAVTWNGEPLSAEVRQDFGYMPEERGLYPKMKIREQLVFFGRLHGMTTARAGERTDKILNQLGLTERAGDTLETLSLGNQQRVQIAAALVHEPIALVMDEPFSGLDPLAVDAMVDLLRDEVTPEVPVLFSSHQLELVERLCDDLIVLSRGKVVAAGPVSELAAGPTTSYRLVVGGDAGWLRDVPGIKVRDVAGGTALFEVASDDDGGLVQQILQQAMSRGQVLEFAPERQALSDVFREATR